MTVAIPTSRTKEVAEIIIDKTKCNACGLCVSVCNDSSLILENNRVKKNNDPIYGCYGCGHCMAICPREAIKIEGRCLSSDDIYDLKAVDERANYQQLLSLYQKRRSVREFSDKNIDEEIIEKILAAARTAPMGLPPSDVNVLIFDNKEKNRAFAKDFCKYLEKMKWVVSNWFLTLMRPFWGKENDQIFKNFIKPTITIYMEKMKEGINFVNYDAPLAMYFYGSSFSDPADPIIAATTAMYAAETLGLGSCMLGAIHPMMQYGKKAKRFREKHKIKYKSKEGIFVIFGYPAVKYRKGIRRSFASEARIG
ncbi:MAG: nitroreductase family protein [Candidatus Woesearchaeota archaeon]